MRPLPKFLPTTSVGSFPKPSDLMQGRTLFAQGKLSSAELRALEEKATVFWIRKQEELDVDLLVDGEQYRGDMATYFAENVKGCEISGLVRSYGNRYYKKPIIVGELRRAHPITVDWFRFSQGLTERPVIGMLTGPYTMMDWSFNEYYKSRAEAAFAWARILNEEARELEAAGARFIQIDEPAVSVRSEEMGLAIETMQATVEGLRAKTITHICYGEFDRIYPRVLDMPVDRIDLEMSNSDLDLLDQFRAHPFTKELGFGVVDVHSHQIETKDVVKSRIRKALKLISPERLYIDPDCGLKTRRVDEAVEKMRVVVESAKEVRLELESGRLNP